MRQRVVHLQADSRATASSANVLLSSDEGDVVAVDDETLTVASDAAPLPGLLYFSRAAFEAAISDLNREQVAEVISRRRRAWSPQAYEQMLNWIYQRERESLTLAAATAPSAYFRASTAWTSRVVGEGRYDDLGTADLLVFAAEKHALLRAELLSEEHAQDADTAREAEFHTEALQKLGEFLADLGRPEFAEGLPYAETSRVVHVFPLDERVLGQLQIESEPEFTWREGLLVNRRHRQIEALRKGGKPAPVVFWDSGWFLEALAELTPAQLTRESDRQAQQTEEQRTHARREYLNGLRLETLLFSHTLNEHAAREAPPLQGLSEHLVATETETLARALTGDRSWIDHFPAGATPELVTSEREICRDLSLFASLARRRGVLDLARRFEALLAEKEAQTRTLTNAPLEHRG